MELRRIFWRCTNIPEYINLGPHAKLSQCAASNPQTETINTLRPDESREPNTEEDQRPQNPRTNSDVLAAQDTP